MKMQTMVINKTFPSDKVDGQFNPQIHSVNIPYFPFSLLFV